MNRNLMFGIFAAAMLGYMGYQGLNVLQAKAEQQRAATEVVQRWKHSYQALAKSTSTWSSRYPDLSQFNDLLGLFRKLGLERYGLAANPDELAIVKSEVVTYNDVHIGLARICISSSSATADSGLLVSASSYSALLRGVRSLAARKDVEIGSLVVLGGSEGQATATLGGFCMLLRQGATQ